MNEHGSAATARTHADELDAIIRFAEVRGDYLLAARLTEAKEALVERHIVG